MILTNQHGISVPLAVWLLHDDYDHIDEPNYISATSFLKSTRQLVLSHRVNPAERELDISAFIASRNGTAIHDSIEKAWRVSGPSALKKLNYPPAVYENIRVNPTDEELAANPAIIPVWIEKRAFREVTVNGITYKIGGKYDMVLEGRLFDAKTTSVYAYLLGRKDDDYKWQGSIYRWLNPDLITGDHIFIQFIFTDWQKARSKGDANYPQTRVLEYPVELASIEDTERFIVAKLTDLQKYQNLAEEQIPHCNDKELWRSETVYKYFTDANNKRATKNFETDKAAAYAYQASQGKGIVKVIPGEVRACEFCPAYDACKQKDSYYVI
jgi:hypothetical protein